MKDNIRKKAEEIAIDFALSIKERTDKLLKLDCDLYTNLGSESSKEDKREVKETSKYIYTRIKGIDEDSGELLLKAFDTEKDNAEKR
jgi:hypothetical protein